MFERLVQWLSPPVFPDDEDKTRNAGALNAILIALIGFTVVGTVLVLSTASDRVSSIIFSVLITGPSVGTTRSSKDPLGTAIQPRQHRRFLGPITPLFPACYAIRRRISLSCSASATVMTSLADSLNGKSSEKPVETAQYNRLY